MGVVLALMAISVLVMFYNRQPPTVATQDGVEAVTVETARGMHVVPLAGPVRRVQQ